MAYSTIKSIYGLVVESEVTGSTIRVFSPQRKKLLFNVSVVHAGDRLARLYNGTGVYNFKVRLGIREYLKLQGFQRFTFERGNPEDGLRPLVGLVK